LDDTRYGTRVGELYQMEVNQGEKYQTMLKRLNISEDNLDDLHAYLVQNYRSYLVGSTQKVLVLTTAAS